MTHIHGPMEMLCRYCGHILTENEHGIWRCEACENLHFLYRTGNIHKLKKLPAQIYIREFIDKATGERRYHLKTLDDVTNDEAIDKAQAVIEKATGEVTMMENYILEGHKAVQVDLETWIALAGTYDKRVAKTTIGNYSVSTVFLGLDHRFGGGPPLLFETMVLGKGILSDEQGRCTTWEEAEAMHIAMCERVRQQGNHKEVGEKL